MVTLKNKSVEEYVLLRTNKTKDKLSIEDILNIKTLNLNSISINKKFNPIYFEDLQYFKNLENLYISNSNISDEDLKYIFSLSQLKTLSLYECTINNLKGINNLNKLENLYISKIGYSNISDISSLQNLKNIKLVGVEIDSLNFLLPLKQLKSLDIRYSKINDASMLKNITSLEQLYAIKTPNLNILDILEMPNLKELQIDNTKDYKTIAQTKKIKLYEEMDIVRSGENV